MKKENWIVVTKPDAYKYGPFKTCKGAADWADKNLNCIWSIERLVEP